ncbi:MAG: hypothetical protein EPN48_11130 [Microbacteriaceae bacterium]|nr:MAG: hypothetical protein EPN48_11130 [Microbacteriaceae bacterium]
MDSLHGHARVGRSHPVDRHGRRRRGLECDGPVQTRGHRQAKDSPIRAGPLKAETDVQTIVLDWVDWYNNERLHSALGNIPPEEYEQTHYAQHRGPSTGGDANKTAA